MKGRLQSKIHNLSNYMITSINNQVMDFLVSEKKIKKKSYKISKN